MLKRKKEKKQSLEEQMTIANESKSNKANKVTKIMRWVLGIIILAGIGFSSGLGIERKVEQKKISEQEAKINKLKSEPHTRLMYYMTTKDVDANTRCDACANLIAHVMTTGCKTAYNELLKYIDDDSLEQIQDYLTGRECSEYETPDWVRIDEEEHYNDYMVRLKNKKKFRVRIKVDSNIIPCSFELSEYEEHELFNK